MFLITDITPELTNVGTHVTNADKIDI